MLGQRSYQQPMVLLSLSVPTSAAALAQWYVMTTMKGNAKKARKIPNPILT